jgi:hypothetical protein
MLRTLAIAAALAMTGGAAHAAESAFDKWFSAGAPQCVPMSEFKKIDGVKIIGLTPEQFQFTRAFYVAIPPISRQLPPGDHAVIEEAPDGTSMLAIVVGTGDAAQTCARFQAPDFIKKILDDVATGQTMTLGSPL